MRATIYGHTGRGPRHEANEDVILVGHTVCTSGEVEVQIGGETAEAPGEGMLVAVADGMGVNGVGAEAARLTLERLDAYFHIEAQGADLRGLANALYNSSSRVNEVVLELGSRQEAYVGMACTLTGVVLLRNEYMVFNAGDSRVYRYCRGVLRQMTEDDTMVAEAVRMGEITFAEAEESEYRHYITNAMGSETFQLRLGERQTLEAGDALLVCSDGLHNVVQLNGMERVLAEHGSAKGRCQALVEAAAKSGDYDDISVIVVNAET